MHFPGAFRLGIIFTGPLSCGLSLEPQTHFPKQFPFFLVVFVGVQLGLGCLHHKKIDLHTECIFSFPS